MRVLLTSFFALFLFSCGHIPPASERKAAAEKLVSEKSWVKEKISSEAFDLAVFYSKNNRNSDHLTIYIEGDGLAWITRSQASSDPTPINPVALKLAIAQPLGDVAYIARPCQYYYTKKCQEKFWTNKRFSEEVVESIGAAIEQLIDRSDAKKITLVGYSGGAAVASLVAARRTDIALLITVAGMVDHEAWTSYHKISPLAGSLNPSDFQNLLNDIPQIHLAGKSDRTVPPELIESYSKGLKHSVVVVIPEFDHECCWVSQWPSLWRSINERADE